MASHKVGGLALSILGVRVVHQPIGLHMPPMEPRCGVEGPVPCVPVTTEQTDSFLGPLAVAPGAAEPGNSTLSH